MALTTHTTNLATTGCIQTRVVLHLCHLFAKYFCARAVQSIVRSASAVAQAQPHRWSRSALPDRSQHDTCTIFKMCWVSASLSSITYFCSTLAVPMQS